MSSISAASAMTPLPTASEPPILSTERNRDRDKALIVALGYKAKREVHVSPTPSAINDGIAISDYLKEIGYLAENIVIMTDDCDDLDMRASKENIVRRVHCSPPSISLTFTQAARNSEPHGGYATRRSARLLL